MELLSRIVYFMAMTVRYRVKNEPLQPGHLIRIPYIVISCVTLGNLLNLSMPQFSHLWHKHKYCSCILEFIWVLHELSYAKHLVVHSAI